MSTSEPLTASLAALAADRRDERASVRHHVSFTACDAHLIDVALRIEAPAAEGQQLSLPTWIPGSYMVRDFSRHIVTMQAYGTDSAGVRNSVELVKIDKSGWRAPPGLATLEVAMRVYAWDLSVRCAHVDRWHAFFNGTSVFLSVHGQDDVSIDVTIARPTHADGADWCVATTLSSSDIDGAGFGRYSADDYDELIDHPVEIGAHTQIDFDVCGVPHAIVLTDAGPVDATQLREDLTRICEHHVHFFGAPAPMSRYLFLTRLVDDGYGGLEHRASTALLASRAHLPAPGAAERSEKYQDFLGLCSHEYFHSWNVKRIKPARFVPYELAGESYTRLLWFFEGVTSYYDDLAMVRAGTIDTARYAELLARTITRVQRGAGRRVQSVTDSSFDAWNKFYKQDENAPNAIVSYYAKGALVAMCLDATMRQVSGGRISLDDMMRELWRRWQKTGAGLAEKEPERLASELVDVDLQDFFDRALYSTEDLPLQESLNTLGARLVWRARRDARDQGAGCVVDSNAAAGVVDSGTDSVAAADDSRWLGAILVDDSAGPRVKVVLNDSPAEGAGLAATDTIIAIDNLAFKAAEIDAVLRRHALGDECRLHYLRSGRLRETTLVVGAAPQDTAVVTIDEAAATDWLSTAGSPAGSSAVSSAVSSADSSADSSALHRA